MARSRLRLWGPIALTLAAETHHAAVSAVDVSERSLDLTPRNESVLGLTNVNAVLPADGPSTASFMTMWSNAPIRVGKNELPAMLSFWLPHLESGADAWMVVHKNLGPDSLQRWLEAEFPESFAFSRAATNKGVSGAAG